MVIDKETSEIMQDIIIVCEDTYGLDVYMIIQAINKSSSEHKYNVIGLLNDNPDSLSGIRLPVPMLGNVQNWNCDVASNYVIAIRDPKNKKNAVEVLKAKGASFETIIAPWVQHPADFTHGEGCIIANYNFKRNSKFGNFVIMDTCMCETVDIGDYSTLCPFVNITTAFIGNGVYVGTHSAIISGRKINDNAVLHAGSIVLNNIRPDMTVAGVPASRNLKKWED